MKVTTKFFMLALILSLMLTVSAVAAAEDISFEKSDTKIIKKVPNQQNSGKPGFPLLMKHRGFEPRTT